MFTIDEALEEGIPHIYWKNVEPGMAPCWILTDDGYVLQCDESRLHGKTVYLRTAIHRGWVTPRKKLLFEEYQRAGYGGVRPQGWKEAEAAKSRTKRFVQVYVQQMLAGKIDWDELGKVYRPFQKIRQATVRRLLKTEEIKSMIRKEVRETYTSNGLTEDFVVKKYLKALEIAEARKNAMALKGLLDSLRDMLDMLPREPKKLTGQFDFQTPGSRMLGKFQHLLEGVPEDESSPSAEDADLEGRPSEDGKVEVLSDGVPQ